MRMQKLISAGFATIALASAAIPAAAWTVWPDVDFEWYANVGQPLNGAIVEITPAPREGYIWVPGHYENRGTRQVYVNGHFIRDDYAQQLAVYNNPNGTTTFASGPVILYDQQGNVIPTNPDAYPVDSARR
jgi:hypothetical protein